MIYELGKQSFTLLFLEFCDILLARNDKTHILVAPITPLSELIAWSLFETGSRRL